jgi:basic membrane protein A and related proteins
MTQHTDSPAPLQVAESRGILGCGVASDMKTYAPRAQLSAILDLWGDYYIGRVQAVLDGTWKSQSIWYGFKEKMLAMARRETTRGGLRRIRSLKHCWRRPPRVARSQA